MEQIVAECNLENELIIMSPEELYNFGEKLLLKNDYKSQCIGISFIEMAANLDHITAKWRLFYLYHPSEIAETDDQKAVDQEHAEVQFSVDDVDIHEFWVEEDGQKAALWLKKAADQGHAEAQYRLAYNYLNGRGCEKDEKLVFEWVRKAADQGHAEAQFAVGDSYMRGFWVEQDDQKAALWLKKAADQGHKEALGQLSKINLDKGKNERAVDLGPIH